MWQKAKRELAELEAVDDEQEKKKRKKLKKRQKRQARVDKQITEHDNKDDNVSGGNVPSNTV